MFFSVCPCGGFQWDNDACEGYFDFGYTCDTFLTDINIYVKEVCKLTCDYCSGNPCSGNSDTCNPTDYTDGPGDTPVYFLEI